MDDKNKFIIIGVLSAVLAGWFPLEWAYPVLLIFLGLSVCIFLSIMRDEDDRRFLITLFLSAFLLRVLAALFIHNLQIIYKGAMFFGDGVNYSKNGYEIAKMWHSGIWGAEDIYARMIARTASGALGNYDFWNGWVYFIFGRSPYTLIFINALAVSLAAIFIYFIAKELCDKKAAVFAAFLTAFWPSMVLWSIQNLKDAISIFLSVVIIWSLVALRARFRFYLLFALFLSSMALNDFRVVAFVSLYFIALPASAVAASRYRNVFLLIILSLAVIIALSGTNIFMVLKPYLRGSFGSSNFMGWINWMRTVRTQSANSAFLTEWVLDSQLKMALFTPAAFAIAWLAPFPWQLASSLQIMAAPEMLIYYSLIPLMIVGISFIARYKFRQGGIIVFYVFVMLIVLAFIEGNVGTLFRHRAMVLPFMFILAGIGYSRMSKRAQGHIA